MVYLRTLVQPWQFSKKKIVYCKDFFTKFAVRLVNSLPQGVPAQRIRKMDKPNILIFMTDQQRGDVVTDGALNRAHTPNLDHFRKEGLAFTHAYCPSPHCCPSRTTFMTGLFPSSHGVWHNVNVGNAISREPYPDTPFWSRDLKANGYNLFFTGKWHVSDHDGPEKFGWEEGFVTSNPCNPRIKGPVTREWEEWYTPDQMSPDNADNRSPGQIIRQGYNDWRLYYNANNPFQDGDVAQGAVEAIRDYSQRPEPWCLYAGPLGPHDPYTPPQEFVDQYALEDIHLPENFRDTMQDKPALYRKTRRTFDQMTEAEHKDCIRHYLAFCSYEDHLFGQVLEALEASGQAENTLVLYLSDHGDYMGEHGLWCKGLPPFKSAYHFPCIARWPAGIQNPGRETDAFLSLADFAPTFYEMTGIENPLPDFAPGRSLLPFFKDEPPEDWRDALFFQTNGNELYGIQRSIMTRDWKYVYNGFDEDELYDLKNDPDEQFNLAGEERFHSLKVELCKRIWFFAREQQDTCINPYIMVGHAPIGPGVAREPEWQ